MSVEIRPLGVLCNLRCRYCYQNPQREAGNQGGAYDIAKIQSAAPAGAGPFILFGGEPLMLPAEDLERLWAWGFERSQQNSVQTNGALIDDRSIELFRKYRVGVGISIDGPGEFNDARWAGSMEKTREATARTEAAIERLCREGMAPSLIVTLHRGNASADKLPRMRDWFRRLDEMGVCSVRLHLLEVEDRPIREEYALSASENIAALIGFALLEPRLARLRFDVFSEIRNLLLGEDSQAACVWLACDPLTTSAVYGIDGRGDASRCGRTNKDGVSFAKAGVTGFERYLALFHTPQQHGGCNGCRFFLACKGQCPGTALDGDWRNRTEYCEVWKAVFQYVEGLLLDEGKFPISAQPKRLSMEQAMLAAWASGGNPRLRQLVEGAN